MVLALEHSAVELHQITAAANDPKGHMAMAIVNDDQHAFNQARDAHMARLALGGQKLLNVAEASAQTHLQQNVEKAAGRLV